MCGIVGVWDTQNKTTESVVQAMSEQVRHRGPDAADVYRAPSVVLAHRRLALLDTSPAGTQPMHFKQWSIVYNGEVYNFTEIQSELVERGHSFKTGTDTEVILHAWDEWGAEALQRFRGMFAFALWNSESEEMWLVRDRLGVKPLYYTLEKGFLAFASELKALLVHPQVPREIDQDALGLFLQLGYVPAPYCIFTGVRKLSPAQYLHLRPDGTHEVHTYWTLLKSESSDESQSESDALKALEEKLSECATLRMIADVPVGVFLSGGVDSSLVTALLKQAGYENLKTFTIGFSEGSHDESKHARAVAEHLGTDHYERTCTSAEAREIIPRIPGIFDEPFADASAIPTYLLAEFTKPHVTAALSADGGDELFGGYHRYQDTLRQFNALRRLPPGLTLLFRCAGWAGSLLSRLPRFRSLPHKVRKARLLYGARHDFNAFYAYRNSFYDDQEVSRLLNAKPKISVTHHYQSLASDRYLNELHHMQSTDRQVYLPDDVLVKVDRATMAVSLEGREPLLDHTLLEHIESLPQSIRFREPGSKWPLRKILYQYVPSELIDRPKQGFGVPLNEWLKGELRPLIDVYLARELIEAQGIFDYRAVEKEKRDFLSGAQPYNRIWNIITFQMWHEEYLK